MGVATAVFLGWRFGRFHRHGAARRAAWLHLLRVVGPSLAAAAVYTIEGLLGLRLILRPSDAAAFGWLAAIVVALYGLGIARAWTLLGDPQHGWSGWLNPLQDLVPTEDLAESREAAAHAASGIR